MVLVKEDAVQAERWRRRGLKGKGNRDECICKTYINEIRMRAGKARKWEWTSRGEREKEPTHQFLSSWLLVGLAQILRLAQGQGDILLPGATLWFGRSQGRPKQTVTLSHASLLFSSDTTIYRLQLWIPWLHTHTTRVPTLTHKHRNKHWVLKITVMHLFSPPIIPLGVSSLAECLNRYRESPQGGQTINKNYSVVTSELWH